MTTTTKTFRRIIGITGLALAGIIGSATMASAATPSHTVTTTTTTTSTGTTKCTEVKDTKANGDYRKVKDCTRPRGGKSHSVSVKVGTKVTTISDTVSVSAKGHVTKTHTVTITINGTKVSQTH
jgi:hypothetical protein